MEKKQQAKAWVVGAEMGYGHLRPAFSLLPVAKGNRVINASLYEGMPVRDKTIWQESRSLYEFISRCKRIPVLGDFVFAMLDKFQEIGEFYSKTQGIEYPTLELRQMYGLIEKAQWGRHLIEKLNANPIPLIATFAPIAFMAEYWQYKGPIWLVTTDTDIARAWVPMNPSRTRIRYFASTSIVAKRLERYGVPKQSIFYTGFPLPQLLTLSAKEQTLKRLQVLDPNNTYTKLYANVIKRYLGKIPVRSKKNLPLTLTFAVGGAGVQEELGKKILRSVAPLIKDKKLKLNLVYGIRQDIARSFRALIEELGLLSLEHTYVRIIGGKTFAEYFKAFNEVLQTTSILWTKPSELTFYTALGLPLIISGPVGSQEVQNQKWILGLGAGIDQLDPELCNQWIFDLLSSGRFAEAAMQGFVEAERGGLNTITRIISSEL